jgi:hypothetical protein
MSKQRPPLLNTPRPTGPLDRPEPGSAPGVSPTASPNDHVRMLTELLKPGGVELARRWLAALLLVPAAEREEVVKAVETRIVAEYDLPLEAEAREVVVRYPAVQREGYVEEVVKRYGVSEGNGAAAKQQRASRRRGRAG